MTKTLTEQWREGTLPCGAYYVNRLGETRIYFVRYEDNKHTHEIYEVLAPVPSYDEFLVLSDFKKIEEDAIDNLVKIHTEKLEKKLEIATKALKKLTRNCNKWGLARRALKEMEGVK